LRRIIGVVGAVQAAGALAAVALIVPSHARPPTRCRELVPPAGPGDVSAVAGRQIATLTFTDPNAVDVDSLAFSRDGRALAAVDGAGNAFVCPVS